MFGIGAIFTYFIRFLGMKTHILKTRSEFFIEVESGDKRAEIRYNDRDFQKGDIIDRKSVV